METMSKAALCALVLAATIKVMADLRVWRKQARGAEKAFRDGKLSGTRERHLRNVFRVAVNWCSR